MFSPYIMREVGRFAVFIVFILLLFGFKKIILDKIRKNFLRYILGMIVVYLLYLYAIYLSMQCEFFQWTNDEILYHIHSHGKGRDWEIVWIFVPAVYSIILFISSKKDASKYSKDDKWGLIKLIIFLLLNIFFTVFIGFMFSYLLSGGSLKEWFVLCGIL